MRQKTIGLSTAAALVLWPGATIAFADPPAPAPTPPPLAPALTNLEVSPPDVNLTTNRSRQLFVVQATFDGLARRDRRGQGHGGGAAK